MDKILVLIDVQSKFIKQCNAEVILPKIAEKIKLRKSEGFEIILTYDKSGGELDKNISALCSGHRIFNKHSYGCEELVLYLKQRNPKTIEFSGVCTDICVITNVLATMTFLPFSDIIVDSGCCASYDIERHKAALNTMKCCNIKII